MHPEAGAKSSSVVNPFTAADVAVVLRERGWLRDENDLVAQWLGEAAALLGPHATDRQQLANLVALIFGYEAQTVLD